MKFGPGTWFFGALCLISLVLPCFAADVAGRVVNGHGQGIPDVRLQIVDSNGSTRQVVVTHDGGSFTVRLPPGQYEIYELETSAFLGRVAVAAESVRVELHLPRPSQGPESQSPNDPEDQEDREIQQLESIAGYRVFQTDSSLPSLRSAGEIFNPFLAKRPRRFHGTFYEFHRNDFFDARNFFDPVGQPLPEYKRNQFGAQFSGSFWSKLTFLAAFDGLRIVQGSTIVSHVPSVAEKNGDFGAFSVPIIDPLSGNPFPNNQIPSRRIDPVASRLLSLIPDPNQADLDRNFINSQPRVTDENRYNFRIDYQWNDATKLVGHYTLTNRAEVRVEPLPNFNSNRTVDHHELRLSLDHRFSDRFLGSFALRINRNVNLLLSQNSGRSGLLDSLGIQGLSILDATDEGFPEFRLSGYARFGDDDSPETSTRNDLRFNTDFNYSWNDHSFSFGSHIVFNQVNDDRNGGNRRGSFEFNGAFTGDSFADFLLGFPESAEHGIGSNRVDVRGKYLETFVRDNWKVSNHFSLTLGLNYQKRPPWRSLVPVSGFFPLLLQPPVGGDFVITGTAEARTLGFSDHTLVRTDNNDFSPRIGIAYSPRGNNSMVIRSGFSVSYHSPNANNFIEDMARNYPFVSQQQAVSSVLEPEIDLENPFARLEDVAINASSIEPDPRTTYTQSWNLSVQKRMGRNLNFEVQYRGNHTIGAQRNLPGNIPLPGPGPIQPRRPNPMLGELTVVSYDGKRSEDSLNIDVERQLANGFAAKAGFRWQKQIHDIFYGGVADPRNFALERAPDDDPEKTFFINYIYELPFGNRAQGPEDGWFNRIISGWRLSGATRVNQGRRFTVQLSSDGNNDGLGGDRPNRIASGELAQSNRSVNAWFDTSAFVKPDAFQIGNSGRNILRAPGVQVWDISLSKNTSLASGHFLEFRVQFFNAFNHVNFSRPETSLGSSDFGQIFGAGNAREVEIALKYSF